LQRITDLIFDYLADRLVRGSTREFERHSKICPDCVSFLNTHKKTGRSAQSPAPAGSRPKFAPMSSPFAAKDSDRGGFSSSWPAKRYPDRRTVSIVSGPEF
jgi:hypothetical protein